MSEKSEQIKIIKFMKEEEEDEEERLFLFGNNKSGFNPPIFVIFFI